MAEKKEMSMTEKLRARLNEGKDKEIAKSFSAQDDLMQVKSWIKMKSYFKEATGGLGWPAGHISQVIGKPDSGKSTCLMEGMVSCQKEGGVVFLIDAEHKFSMERFTLMGGKPEDIVTIQVDSLEQAWTAIEEILKQAATIREEGFTGPLMMAWDSVASSVPESIKDSEAGAYHVAVDAKINNKNVRRLRSAIKAVDIACVFINHYYFTQPKTMYEQPELIIKGGEELTFLSTLIIRTKQGKKIERTVLGEKQKIGRVTKFFVHKGHFHGRTIDKDVNVVDIGVLNDVELEEYQKSLRGKF